MMFILNMSLNYLVVGGEVTCRTFPLPAALFTLRASGVASSCVLSSSPFEGMGEDKAEERHPIIILVCFWSLISLFRERGRKKLWIMQKFADGKRLAGRKDSRGSAIGSPKMTSFGFKNTPLLRAVELEQCTASKTIPWDCFRPLLNISAKYYYGRQALL